jgi:hypothetical protein
MVKGKGSVLRVKSPKLEVSFQIPSKTVYS